MPINQLPPSSIPPITDLFICGMSRSGTTLLVTILDSHPDVSMGYELLPAGLGSLQECANLIRSSQFDNADQLAKELKTQSHNSLSTFIKRAYRTLVEPNDLAGMLDKIHDTGLDPDSFQARILLSRLVAQHKKTIENASLAGFKLNAPSITAFDQVLLGQGANPGYIFITRDPRDIVASHLENNFNRTIEHIGNAWNQYLTKFLAFQAANPDRPCHLIRYEDLVCEPDANIETILEKFNLPPSQEPRNFYQSKASVHTRGHRNQDQLSQDIYANKLARWTTDLSIEQTNEIQSICKDHMAKLGYHTVNSARPSYAPERSAEGKKIQRTHKRKKKFYRDQYAELILPLTAGRTNLTWAQASRHESPESTNVLILRHDVDHDLQTALHMAQWEHDHGLKATYCILHTAWYYGRFHNGAQERSQMMLDGCRQLQELGHEINIHNNFIVQALQHKLDASAMLLDEIAYFRANGINIQGTSTHGDAICRELDFRNFELFKDRAYPSRGGQRTIESQGMQHPIGSLPPELFALDYEAYDLPRDTYISDSGGNLRVRRNTRGIGGLRRKQLDNPPPYHVLGILTHPIWWDMTQDAPKSSTLIGIEDLQQSDFLSGPLESDSSSLHPV